MPWGEYNDAGGDVAAAGDVEPTDHVIVSELPADITEAKLKEVFGQYGTIKWCKLSLGKGGGGKGGSPSAIIELDSVDEASYFVTALDENIPEGLTTPIRVRYKPPKSGGGFKGGKGGGKDKGAGGFASVLGAAVAGATGGKDRPGPYTGGKGGKGFEKGGKGGIQDVIKGLTKSNTLPGGKWQNDENTVFVSGLPPDTTNNDLLRIFSPFGAIAIGGCHCPLNPDGTARGSGIINFLDANGAQAAVSTLNGVTTATGTYLKLRAFTPKAPSADA